MKLADLLGESDWDDDDEEWANRRGWVNPRTGEIVEPVEFSDHYAVLEDDLHRFLTPEELQGITGHDTYSPGIMTRSHSQAVVLAIFAKGWVRTIHNATDGHLWLEGDTLRDVQLAARLMAKDGYVAELLMDVGDRGCRLEGEDILRFLKSPSPENLPIRWQAASAGDTQC